MASASRVRRPAADSKARILDAAERLLIEGGPMAVQVRAVAALVGMTDAGVSHHFGTRDELLVALLHHGSRRLRDAVDDVVHSWVDDSGAVEALVQSIAALYRNRYGELAIALYSAGWRSEGKGMLDPVVNALHSARTRRDEGASLMDTRLAVAALHQALAIDPVYGASFRRSAGIARSTAQRVDPQLEWWTKTLIQALGLESR
jgi:AcrR family transcriptional regulator